MMENEEEEEEESDDDLYAMDDSQMISIHTSFIISNFKTIAAKDVDLTHEGILWNSFADFVNTLMNDVCPEGAACNDGPEREDDDDDDFGDYDDDQPNVVSGDDVMVDDAVARANETDSANVDIDEHTRGRRRLGGDIDVFSNEGERRLCGPEYEHVRRTLCHGRRGLRSSPRNVTLEDLELYEIKDTKCPPIHHHSGTFMSRYVL